jgi:hypothetical protein
MTSADEDDLTTWTLGAIKRMGMVLEGACATEGCNAFARFDLDGLITRFGADWRVPKVLPARCSVCDAPLKFQLAVLHDEEPDA